MPKRGDLFRRLAGDRLLEVLVLLAVGADACHLDQLGLGEIKLALLGIGFPKIFVGVDVARIEASAF